MSEPKEKASSAEPSAGSSLMLLAKVLLVICAVQFFALSWFVYDKKKAATSEPAKTKSNVTAIPTRAASSMEDNYSRSKPGPWGELEYLRMNLVVPEDYASTNWQNLPPTRWHFASHNTEKLAAFIKESKLTEAQKNELLDPAIRTEQADGVVLAPGEALVLALSPEARQQVYTLLAESPANRYQHQPFTFRAVGFEDWFQNSGVSSKSQVLIRKLVYQRGPSLCFSDLREVLAQAADDTERQSIVKALCRRTGVVAKLRVNAGSDLAALTKYWARGSQAKDIGTLFDSLAKVPGGTAIDIAHLLPPFARSRLNTFPAASNTPNAQQPDAYWTALNFFSTSPGPFYRDAMAWRQDLLEKYTQVESPTYGDLIFLVQPDGVPHHAAVFIADNIVFTKLGGSSRHPWLLMRVEDMLAHFPSSKQLALVIFKPKN